MIRLHDNLSSGNGYKARLLLAQLAIPFERIDYYIDAGETRTPRFLEKVNPNGRVPVLQTEDGRFLPESNVILCYLAEATLEAANIAPDVAVKCPLLITSSFASVASSGCCYVPCPAHTRRAYP